MWNIHVPVVLTGSSKANFDFKNFYSSDFVQNVLCLWDRRKFDKFNMSHQPIGFLSRSIRKKQITITFENILKSSFFPNFSILCWHDIFWFSISSIKKLWAWSSGYWRLFLTVKNKLTSLSIILSKLRLQNGGPPYEQITSDDVLDQISYLSKTIFLVMK